LMIFVKVWGFEVQKRETDVHLGSLEKR